MTESGVIEKTALVFGQMNEPPGARLRVGLTRADDGRVLPRRDRTRTCCCSSTTSSASSRLAPRCRRCWAGCQARWATSRPWPPRWVSCRSASPRPARARSPRCRRSTCPADDLTDPAPAASFAHLDATTVLSRSISEKGIYPAVDPLDSTSRILQPGSVVRAALQGRHPGAAGAAALQGPAGHHRHPRHGRAVRRGQGDRAAGAQDRALPVAAVPCRRAVHGLAGPLRQARGDDPLVQEVLDGKHDDLPEQAFYLVGGIEEALERAEKLKVGA